MNNATVSFNAHESFSNRYASAIIIAAVAFGLSHGMQQLIRMLAAHGFINFKYSGLITLTVVSAVEVVVFVVVGFVLAYAPLRVIESAIAAKSVQMKPVMVICVGIVLGFAFTPISAGFAYVLFHGFDLPSYLNRCEEFATPMIVAGLCGAIRFWFPDVSKQASVAS